MNAFDIIYISGLFIFFGIGVIQGFLRSLIGPLCLAFWSIIGVLNYDLNKNIFLAAAIAIIGGLISSLIIKFFFFIGKQNVHAQHRYYVFWPSRILGGVLHMGWNGLIFGCIAAALSIMPSNFLGQQTIQKSVTSSTTYQMFSTYIIAPFPPLHNIQTTLTILQNHALLQRYQDTKEYAAVFSNPKIQELLSSPDITEKLQTKNAIFLLNDQRVKHILNDARLMTNITVLTKMIYREQSGLEQTKESF